METTNPLRLAAADYYTHLREASKDEPTQELAAPVWNDLTEIEQSVMSVALGEAMYTALFAIMTQETPA